MQYGQAVIVDGLRSRDQEPSRPIIYDRDIGIRLLYQEGESCLFVTLFHGRFDVHPIEQ